MQSKMRDMKRRRIQAIPVDMPAAEKKKLLEYFQMQFRAAEADARRLISESANVLEAELLNLPTSHA